MEQVEFVEAENRLILVDRCFPIVQFAGESTNEERKI